jgi:uncharacterized protein (TIGR02217 family)
MSTQVFPSLAGLTYPFDRTPMWDTTVQPNVSGKEVRLANQTFPRYQWDLIYSALRQGLSAGTTYNELKTLMGFYNARQGSFDSFLFTDPDDCSITGQDIGEGDGTTLTFQLVRANNYVEPIQAPNAVATVYVDGVDQVGHWTVSNWGTATPGVITFASGHAPANGKIVSADFTYYWPVRFNDDSVPFSKWIGNMYEVKKISLISVKN